MAGRNAGGGDGFGAGEAGGDGAVEGECMNLRVNNIL